MYSNLKFEPIKCFKILRKKEVSNAILMSLSHLQKNEEKKARMVRQLTARPTSIFLKLNSFWILFSHPNQNCNNKIQKILIKNRFFFDTEDFVLIF